MVLPRWLSKLREFERKIGIVEILTEDRDFRGEKVAPGWRRLIEWTLALAFGLLVLWGSLRLMCKDYQGCQDAHYEQYP